jgi:transcriptional regulator with XRE-family HTH domain
VADRVPPPEDGRRLFAANLRRLRRAAGVTQEHLAEAAGLDRSYISLVENARANVSLDVICRIATVLRVRPVDLLRPEAAGK